MVRRPRRIRWAPPRHPRQGLLPSLRHHASPRAISRVGVFMLLTFTLVLVGAGAGGVLGSTNLVSTVVSVVAARPPGLSPSTPTTSTVADKTTSFVVQAIPTSQPAQGDGLADVAGFLASATGQGSLMVTVAAADRPPGADGGTGSRWYPGTFTVGVAESQVLETVSFVLVDFDPPDGQVDQIELSADDGQFGETRGASLDDLVLGADDDEQFGRETGSQTSRTLTLGGLSLTVSFDRDILGGRATVHLDWATVIGQFPLVRDLYPVAVRFVTEPSVPSPDEIVADTDGQWVVRNQIVIGIDANVADPARRIYEIAAQTGGRVVGGVPQTGTYQVEYGVPDLVALEQLRSAVGRIDDVAFASRHYLQDGALARIPDDPETGTWDTAMPAGNNWQLETIDAPMAWELTTGDPSLRVAIIDGDMDIEHGDLVWNVNRAEGNRTPEWGGHGTHVATTACGKGNNGRGISGVAWDCSLLLYELELERSSPVWAQQRMVMAIDAEARIVNMSMQFIDNNRCETPGTEATRQKVLETNAIFGFAVDYALRHGKDVLWVFAAGNECREAIYASPASLTLHYPANTIAVASVDPTGAVSSFSNGGRGVELSAPGRDIFSALPRYCQFGGAICVDQYGVMSGTSMAAPIVTGVAALIRSLHPEFTAARVKECLLASRTGPYWVVNAEKAVRCEG